VNVSESNLNDFNDGYRNILSSSEILLNLLISYFKKFNNEENEIIFKEFSKNQLKSFSVNTRMLCQSLIFILKNEDVRAYLHIRMHNDNLLFKLSQITSFLAMNKLISVQDPVFPQFFNIVNDEIFRLHEWINKYSLYVFEVKENEEKIKNLEKNIRML